MGYSTQSKGYVCYHYKTDDVQLNKIYLILRTNPILDVKGGQTNDSSFNGSWKRKSTCHFFRDTKIKERILSENAIYDLEQTSWAWCLKLSET